MKYGRESPCHVIHQEVQGACESEEASMRIMCMMMQLNEADLLPLWHAYHSSLFGAENLVIIDNGSTHPDVLDALTKIRSSGTLVLLNANASLSAKGDIIGSLINRYESFGNVDFFMPLDCDEFVGVKIGDSILFDVDSIEDELSKHAGCMAPISILGSYYNDAGVGDRFFFWEEKKTFFRAGTFDWMDEGFHTARTKTESNPVRSNIIHVHYQYKPLSLLKSHAKQKFREYIDVNDEASIRCFEGPGSHAVRYYTMTEDEYSNFFDQSQMVRLVEYEKALAVVGCRPPFKLVNS